MIYYIMHDSKNEYHKSFDNDYLYLFGEEKGIIGLSMNTKYLFFWNLGNAWKMNLKSKEITRLKLYISEKETMTFIKKLRTGSDETFITIIVEQSAT